ncbi:MAG: Eco47II family restriction endonuclease [Kiritimatiellia bacterium]|uniref:Eco47II family restriction endonuclease n=1 Tax=Atribacter sp. TaxID=2847780 RepID=UPI003D98EE65
MKQEKNQYKLSFISDADLKKHTLETVSQFRTSMTLAEFQKNIVDPIKLAFDAHVYGQSIDDVIETENIRQFNKTNENLIGYFHQNIFKYIGRGWEVPQTGEDGWDVENHERDLYAEFKNKHNTMNSASAKSVHARMRGLVEGNSRATCYLVEVIAKKSQDIPWKLAHAPLRESRQERLRRISIDRFYEIVTGDDLAFANLCSVIGKVIDDVLAENPNTLKANSVLAELNAMGGDVLKTLFTLSFSTYRGFDAFTIRR